MALQNAIDFIADVHEKDELRKKVNAAEPSELFDTLENEGYKFSSDEFEEAVNVVHVQCKFEEQAMALLQVAHWFRLLQV